MSLSYLLRFVKSNGPQVFSLLLILKFQSFWVTHIPLKNQFEFPKKHTPKDIFYPLFLKFPLPFISLAAIIMNMTEITKTKGE